MIDESGNLGIQGTYFVLTMFNTSNRNKAKRVLRKFQKDYLDKEEIKGSQLNLILKQKLLSEMKKFEYGVHYIVADKTRTNLFRVKVDKNLIYNYLLQFIIVKIIKENFSCESLHFHLDNHTIKVKSLNSFEDYIKLKAIENNYFGEITVTYFDSHKHVLIQAADIMSNIIWNKYERKRQHLYKLIQANIKTSFKFPMSAF